MQPLLAVWVSSIPLMWQFRLQPVCCISVSRAMFLCAIAGKAPSLLAVEEPLEGCWFGLLMVGFRFLAPVAVVPLFLRSWLFPLLCYDFFSFIYLPVACFSLFFYAFLVFCFLHGTLFFLTLYMRFFCTHILFIDHISVDFSEKKNSQWVKLP